MEKVSIKVNNELAAELCRQLLEPFDKMPIESFQTILNAFTMATMAIAGQMKEETECSEVDGLEKQILRWMVAVEKGANMNFSKYINLNKED